MDGWLPGTRRCLHLQDLLFVAEGSNSDDDLDDYVVPVFEDHLMLKLVKLKLIASLAAAAADDDDDNIFENDDDDSDWFPNKLLGALPPKKRDYSGFFSLSKCQTPSPLLGTPVFQKKI